MSELEAALRRLAELELQRRRQQMIHERGGPAPKAGETQPGTLMGGPSGPTFLDSGLAGLERAKESYRGFIDPLLEWTDDIPFYGQLAEGLAAVPEFALGVPQDLHDYATGLAAGEPESIAELAMGPIGTFGPPRIRDRNRAEKLEQSGADELQIFNETGLFRGADGKWREEFDDSGMSLELVDDDPRLGKEYQLNHPELYARMPRLERVLDPPQVFLQPGKPAEGEFWPPEYGDPGQLTVFAPDEAQALAVGAHELQHPIQHAAKFASGASPASFRSIVRRHVEKALSKEKAALEAATRPGQIREIEARIAGYERTLKELDSLYEQDPDSYEVGISFYNKVAGEQEARLSERRRALSAEERRSRPPFLEFEIPREQQLLLPPRLNMASASFAGPRARTADHEAKRRAIEMEKAGASPLQIKRETNWERLQDGQWAWSLPDNDIMLFPRPQPDGTTQFDISHPHMENAYPGLMRNLEFDISLDPSFGSYEGHFLPDPDGLVGGQIHARAGNKKKLLDTLVHELGGHAVAAYEGFPAGVNPMDSPRHYRWLIENGLSKARQSLQALRNAAADDPDFAERAYNETKELEHRVQLYEQSLDMLDRRLAEADNVMTLGWDNYFAAAGEQNANLLEEWRTLTPEQLRERVARHEYDVPVEHQWSTPRSLHQWSGPPFKPPYDEDAAELLQDEHGRYSPSLLAAHNLPQDKGTYEQMRSMLLKHGAKEDELVWSGFDLAFDHRNDAITRDEIVEWLTERTRLVQRDDKRSSEDFMTRDKSMLVQEVLNDPESKRRAFEHMRVQAPDDLLHHLGYDYSMNFHPEHGRGWWYRSDGRGDVEEVLGSTEDAIRSIPEEDLDPLLETFLGDLDPEDLRQILPGDSPAFDPGETRYSGHIAPGLFDYQESLFRHTNPFGTRNPWGDYDPHWNPDSQHPVLYHMRTGTIVEDPASGGKTYFVGEMQSDWGQKLRRIKENEGMYAMRPTTPKEEMADSQRATMLGKNPPMEEGVYRNLSSTGRNEHYPFPVGPFVDSTSKWVDHGIRQALIDGMRKGADRVVFTSGEMAQAHIMGNLEGQRGFYGGWSVGRSHQPGIVGRRLAAVLKRIDPSLQPQTYVLPDNSPGWSVELTPELKQYLQTYGLPQMSVKKPDELPMDHESRMQRAEEMGFDLPAYHFTKSDFSEFGRSSDLGHHVALTPDIPNAMDNSVLIHSRTLMASPTFKPPTGQNIMPLRVRAKNPLAMPDYGDDWLDGVHDELVRVANAAGRDDLLNDLHQIDLDYRALENERSDAAYEEKFRSVQQEMARIMEELGYDSIIYNNLYETLGDDFPGIGPMHDMQRHFADNLVRDIAKNPEKMKEIIDQARPDVKKRLSMAVLNPTRLRSQHAKFDPAKIDSKDLLASFTAGPTLLALELWRQKSEEERRKRNPSDGKTK